MRFPTASSIAATIPEKVLLALKSIRKLLSFRIFSYPNTSVCVGLEKLLGIDKTLAFKNDFFLSCNLVYVY